MILTYCHHNGLIYDNTPLAKTLEKFIDFKKLSPDAKQNSINYKNKNNNKYNNTRLIITAVDVLTAVPIIFDSYKTQIEMKHLLATIGYPTEVQSRAKDIMFTDKDVSLRKMSRLITRHINLIETLYNIFNEFDNSKLDKI